MSERTEALVVLCRCGENHKPYGIRAEKLSSKQWSLTWAFPIKEASAKREGYDRASIGGEIGYSTDYPGCPYCGRRELTVCSCGHLSCTVLNNGIFTCEWCGSQGTLGDYTGEAITAGMDL